MKTTILFTTLLLLNAATMHSQADTSLRKTRFFVEPGIGITPMPLVDLMLSAIIQCGISKNISAISYTSFKENNPFIRNFNHIRTTNNHSISQKFGIGLNLKTKRSIHCISMLAGAKYETYRETLNNPEFEKISVKIDSWSPDLGLMYNLKLGRGKYFLSYRMYIPLFPYPIYTADFTSIDGNLADVSLELGFGIRIQNN